MITFTFRPSTYMNKQEFETDRQRAFSARGDRGGSCAAAVCADCMMRQIVRARVECGPARSY
jgi:hypothetical protein